MRRPCCSPTLRAADAGEQLCRRRWWSQAVTAAGLFPRTLPDKSVVHDFKLHELRHTAASLAIQAGCNIKALQKHARARERGADPGPLWPSLRVRR